MSRSSCLAALLLLHAAASLGCGRSYCFDCQAIGTYIGGGSFLIGSDPCEYAGEAGVFDDEAPALSFQRGPRFVVGEGRILQRCGTTVTPVRAQWPTAALITGPKQIRAGAESEMFQGELVSGNRILMGKGNLDWSLGRDCRGVAVFAPVLGSSDTGGPDRFRTLRTSLPGTCTLTLRMTTGDYLSPHFKPQTYDAAMTVEIRAE
jgi:hypothetical protein